MFVFEEKTVVLMCIVSSYEFDDGDRMSLRMPSGTDHWMRRNLTVPVTS